MKTFNEYLSESRTGTFEPNDHTTKETATLLKAFKEKFKKLKYKITETDYGHDQHRITAENEDIENAYWISYTSENHGKIMRVHDFMHEDSNYKVSYAVDFRGSSLGSYAEHSKYVADSIAFIKGL